MSSVNAINLSKQENAPFIQEYNEKGFRIGKAAKIALHVLTVTSAVGTVAAAFTACVITAPWTITVLAVSAVALCILFAAEILAAIRPHLSEKLQSVVNMARSTVVDGLVKLVCLALYPISQTHFDPKKDECSDEHTPTLFVHGYLHNSSGWLYWRHRLKVAGRKNLFTIDLGHPFLPIEDYAKKVGEKVKKIQELTGRNDCHFVGHSMGGVVTSYYATHLAEDVVVKSVVTLGSPLNGTLLRGVGPGAKQMRYQSEFIIALREKILASDIPFYHLGSETDLIIRPTSSTVIKDHKFTMFPNLGHASFLFSDRVIRHSLSFYNHLDS